MYTQLFSEDFELLATLWPAAAISSETNVPSSNFVDVSKYHRVVILLFAGDIGTSLNADVEIATDNSATALHTLKSITALTEAGGDDNSAVVIEIQSEELTKPSGASGTDYTHMRLEITPSGNCYVFAAIFGFNARYKPVDNTDWDEVKT